MVDGTVYYCWSCDAHRKVRPDSDGRTTCPGCRRPLGDDAKLEKAAHSAGPILAIERAAAKRSLAASA